MTVTLALIAMSLLSENKNKQQLNPKSTIMVTIVLKILIHIQSQCKEVRVKQIVMLIT